MQHAGYDADPQYRVTGFSQLHDDGTGGDIPLSNFKLFPQPTCASFVECLTTLRARSVSRALKEVPEGSSFAIHGSTVAPDDYGRPGYFSTNLSTGVRVELTATRRAALHRYTFPSRPASTTAPIRPNETDWRPRILVDITNDGKFSGAYPYVDIIPESGRITGGARFSSSFGAGTYRAHVCVDFRDARAPEEVLVPAEYGVYVGPTITANATEFVGNRWGERGAIMTFEAPTVLARVGVSFISSQKACANAEEEIPDFNFEGVKEDARQTWNELLGRFEVAAGEQERDTAVLFYSSVSGNRSNTAYMMRIISGLQLYRSHIVPSDCKLSRYSQLYARLH